jgi:thioredoxin-like negative regulator of GroEL
VEVVARELAGRLKVVMVNVDEGPLTSARLAVASVPTILMLRAGQVVARHIGLATIDRLVDWVRTSSEADRLPS